MLKLKKLYQGVLWAMMFCLLILAVCNVVPRFFGIRPYIVLSGSMEPALPTGSIVYTNCNISPRELQIGDIITYRQRGTLITHRIIEESTDTVITKGDANEDADFSPVSRTSILGKCVFHIPFLGYFYVALRTPTLYLFLFVLIVLKTLLTNLIPHLTSRQTPQKYQKENKI